VKTFQSGFKWLLAVLNLIFPQNCIFFRGDRRGGEYLCCTSFNDFGLIHSPICFVCEVFRQSPYKFYRAGTLGLYDTVLRQLIHHFKYQKQLGVLSDIDCLLEKYFSEYGKEYWGLTFFPIPRHFNKMRERV
jgi:predicted amidophosphoribosyltransferase